MDDTGPELRLADAGLAGMEEVNEVRLAGAGAGALLATSAFRADAEALEYESRISLHPWPPGSGEARSLVLPQLLPGPPAWDTAWSRDGRGWVVREVNGGAKNALHLEPVGDGGEADPAGADPGPGPPEPGRGERVPVEIEAEPGSGPPGATVVSASRSRTGFNRPRFVNGAESAGGWAVSAVSDERELAVFFPGGGGAYRYWGAGVTCDEGVVVRHLRGVAAVCKNAVPGLARPGTTSRPGVLSLHHWAPGERSPAASAPLLAEAPVYDFDAVAFGGDVAVLAVRKEDAVLALGPAWPAHGSWRMARVTAGAGTLSLPTLVRIGEELHLAVVSDARTPGARLLAARWRPGG